MGQPSKPARWLFGCLQGALLWELESVSLQTNVESGNPTCGLEPDFRGSMSQQGVSFLNNGGLSVFFVPLVFAGVWRPSVPRCVRFLLQLQRHPLLTELPQATSRESRAPCGGAGYVLANRDPDPPPTPPPRCHHGLACFLFFCFSGGFPLKLHIPPPFQG